MSQTRLQKQTRSGEPGRRPGRSGARGRSGREAWLIATLAITLVVALSACGGRGLAGAAGSGSSGQVNGQSGQTSGQSSQAASQAQAVNDLAQVDASLNGIMSSMNSAQQDATIDQSGSDNEGMIPAAAVLPAIALAVPQTSQALSACDLSCLQAFGDKQIGNRLTSLGDATTKINTLVSKGHLTSAQATPLLNQITTNENNLKSLQASLDAISGDTKDNEALARQDDKDIFTVYRIYAVFLPVGRHVVLLDVMTNVDQKMRAAQPKIEKAIDGDTQHKDQLNALYADYKTQLAEAEAQIDAAQGQLPVLTPSTFDEHNGDYQTAWNALKADCQSAFNALKQARNDLHQIVTIVKGDLGSAATTPTATNTPSS